MRLTGGLVGASALKPRLRLDQQKESRPSDQAASFKNKHRVLLQGDQHLNHTFSLLKGFQSLANDRPEHLTPIGAPHGMTRR